MKLCRALVLPPVAGPGGVRSSSPNFNLRGIQNTIQRGRGGIRGRGAMQKSPSANINIRAKTPPTTLPKIASVNTGLQQLSESGQITKELLSMKIQEERKAREQLQILVAKLTKRVEALEKSKK